MKIRYIVAIGFGACIWAFFLFGVKSLEAAPQEECDLRIRGRLEAGGTIVKVRGTVGSHVTVSDYASDAVLGTGTLSGDEVCRGSAEIELSQPLIGEQTIRVTDEEANEDSKWVWPPLPPSIEIAPYCGDNGKLDGMLYGYGWEADSTLKIYWEAELLDTLSISEPVFEHPIVVDDLEDGLYEISASSNGYTTTTLFELPCPDFGHHTEIGGTVYVDTMGTWIPASHAAIFYSVANTQFEDSTQARFNGRYRIETQFAKSHTISSCIEIDGQAYADSIEGVVAPATDADLYLMPTGSAECDATVTPQEPPDLTIGIPQVTPIDTHTLSVTVTISNSSAVSVTHPFYVDASIRHGGAFNYVKVQGLAAYTSMDVVITLETPYPIEREQIVRVMVDGAHEIDEFDEENNIASNKTMPTNRIDSVAVYLLAFDNPSYSAGNLTPQLPETLKGIRAATRQDNRKLAVVLADLDQDGDTHIMTVYNGRITYLDGLPDTLGVLDTDIREYDMSDGQTLGGFLRWTRDNFPARQSSLFVYAHGAPLAPDIDLDSVFDLSTTTTRDSTPIPLPSWVWTNPDFTDMHPVGLLTPYDLRVALDAATDSGSDKYDVVDLVHCFSLSIEEVYEIAPYSDAISGSPNYAYFSAELPGAALAAIEPDMNGEELADKIIETYNDELPSEGYPRLMTALNTRKLEATKQSWDTVSAELIRAFDADHADTHDKLTAAYQNSSKYDTTFCEPDWTLSPPDALSDMFDFAIELETHFGEASEVGVAARETAEWLEHAVTSRYGTDGTPHFTTDQVASSWEFTGLGVSLYTDFGGIQNGSATQLSWHADFYTKTVSAENPNPYRFISDTISWADVFARYWEGIETTSHGCVATFPPVRDSGEVRIAHLINPQQNETGLHTPLQPSISLEAAGELGNVIVQFAIEQNGMTVYSDTVGTGRIFTGTHWVSAVRSWTPATTDPFTLTITADPDDFIDEADETDNQMVFVDAVSAESGTSSPPDATLLNNQQWITDLNAPLSFSDGRFVNSELKITAYQFMINDGVGAPFVRGSKVLTTAGGNIQVPLGTTLSAGAIRLHVWEIVDDEYSQLPTPLQLNYIPANTSISQGEMHCFPFDATVGDDIQLRLNVPDGDDANLFVWYPYSYASPDLIGTRVGDDDLLLDAPITGEYLLCVRGETAGRDPNGNTTYTLSVIENGDTLFTHPTTPENDADATVPTHRILYEDPAPSQRASPTAVRLRYTSAVGTFGLMLIAGLFLTLTLITTRRR